MTDREKAIVMAYTGKCMLTGDKFQIFHKYVENIMGRPIYTHDIGWLEDDIKEKSKDDFIALCEDESNLENPNRWISVSERLPKTEGRFLTYIENPYNSQLSYIMVCDYINKDWCPDDESASCNVIAWMPLPRPYKEENE